ncbi:MAG: zinc-ribbon domain-containing protein [Ruminococcus sp.]|nr:zinc-ribbon domain-containing protein [Ruminococcus sp.]
MKNCTTCGAPLEDNAVFCGNCGSSLESRAPQQPQFNQPQFNQPQQPQFNQPQQFGQPFNPNQGFGSGAAVKQGSNKALIGIIAAVVGIGIIVLVLFLFVFKSDYKKDIIGTWVDTTDSTSTMTFEEGGKMSMKLMGINVSGTYEISGSTLKMKYSVLGVTSEQEFKIDSMSSSNMTLKDTKKSNTIYKLKKK